MYTDASEIKDPAERIATLVDRIERIKRDPKGSGDLGLGWRAQHEAMQFSLARALEDWRRGKAGIDLSAPSRQPDDIPGQMYFDEIPKQTATEVPVKGAA